MKVLASLILSLAVTGCAVTPYKQLNLDTTSNFKVPTEGMAGIYVYQWKSGIIGAALDVKFEVKGQPAIALNTGEYGYFEIAPGNYEYKLMGGLIPVHLPVEFEANKNYFFRAQLVSAEDRAVLVREQAEINEAKKNILSGRYEIHDLD